MARWRVLVLSNMRKRARTQKDQQLSKTNYWRQIMATTWTPERRARQAALIRTWKPWEQASGPRTPEGKAKASRNAWRGGHRQMLRDLSKLVNAEVRASRELVSRCQ